ncbi:MAG: CRISPR-associated endonuclease Cas1 [Candidatus Micrarchaeota archaeon]|nr:CRISPR-associated endonuclease Cas1 [Candidatus Micrarchaeota archaeon]
MNPLLISGFGTNIKVDKRKLVITNKLDKMQIEFYPHQIPYDSIIVDGHTGNITFEALRWLMKHDISVSMLNWNGELLSVALPKAPVSSKLRIMQYKMYLDEKERLKVAATIIKEKVAKSFELLEKLSDYYNSIDMNKIKNAFENENRLFGKIRANDELMTYEGRIADIYWVNITKIFDKLYPEFRFEKRGNKTYSHNVNASDEINALLNYGYAVLESEIRKDINAIGLDASIGFLHEIHSGRASLVCDAQELYRWLIDLSVIQLLEERKLKKSDFIVTENYHVRLKEHTAKLLIEKIRINFNKRMQYKGKSHSYEGVLLDNVRILGNHIIGKSNELKFSLPEIDIVREDNSNIRDRILNINPEERKKLGINKSTLWYQKKHIKEGKKIKIYTKTRAKL